MSTHCIDRWADVDPILYDWTAEPDKETKWGDCVENSKMMVSPEQRLNRSLCEDKARVLHGGVLKHVVDPEWSWENSDGDDYGEDDEIK